ncbi:MAG: hypothetical protein WBQ18_17280, partial [Solirubrobacteraceae bacterium]
MSEIAEYPRIGLRRADFPVSEFSVSLTLCLITVTGVTAALSNAPARTEELALPLFLLGAAAMFGLALADIARRRELRYARTLILVGILWSLSALTASREPITYSIGHVSQWLVDLAVAYLLLSYPSTRLRRGPERMLFIAGALLVGLLFLPTALAGQYPHPSLWSTCTTQCPTNAFSLTASTPAVIANVIVPLREVLAVAVFAAITLITTRRTQQADPQLRPLHAPVAVFAALQMLIFAVYFPLRAAAPGSDTLSVVSWMFVLSLPAVGLACGSGWLYRRLHAATVLERMATTLRVGASPGEVSSALATALHDPSLQVLHSFPG